jgi:hypothetical protein
MGLGPRGGREGAGSEAVDRITEARGEAGAGCGVEVRVGGEAVLLSLSPGVTK